MQRTPDEKICPGGEVHAGECRCVSTYQYRFCYTSNMIDEFELTYLVKELPPGFSSSVRSKEIMDIYVPASVEHPTLRIRMCGEEYEITKKEPVSENDSSHHTENTIPLTKEEYADLAVVQGKRVRKVRYYHQVDTTTYEIDVFQDALTGLVLVDVEFSVKEEKSLFVPPAWVLADVTQEKFLAGGMLCGKSYSDIEKYLVRFGYRPITLVSGHPLQA